MYTNRENIESYLARDLASGELNLLDGVLTVVDEWINHQIGGSFNTDSADVEATAKYYDGGCKIIDIDPSISVTAVELVDSDYTVTYTYEASDYIAQPLNETLKKWVERRAHNWPSGLGNIKVTAVYTMGQTVPNDITYLATYLAGRMYESQGHEGLKKESIEGYSVEFADFTEEDEKATLILAKYTDDDIII